MNLVVKTAFANYIVVAEHILRNCVLKTKI